MKKRIQLADGLLLIEIDDNGYIPFTSIKRAYMDNGILQKMITFSMWDDFEFNAYSNQNLKELDFSFDNRNPIYSSLNKLLGNDTYLIIDDDHTLNKLQKFMSIEKKENNIVVHFVGNNDSRITNEKFSVFIKNIGPDARSKIQNSNLKMRLIDFFRDCENSLLKENCKSLDEL